MNSLLPRFLSWREQLYFITVLGNLPCCSYSKTLAPAPSSPRQWLGCDASLCQLSLYCYNMCWLSPLLRSCHRFLVIALKASGDWDARAGLGLHSLGDMIMKSTNFLHLFPLHSYFVVRPFHKHSLHYTKWCTSE